jgi:hypothetical protein
MSMNHIFFYLLGCSEQDLINQKTFNSDSIPIISVQPSRIDFEQSENQSQSSSFTISNVGQGTLEIENIELDNELEFSMWYTTQSLFADESMEVVVDYQPQQAHSLGNIRIYSNDPENNISLVELTGQGRFPEFNVYPNPVDFGEVMCDDEQSVVLSNSGNTNIDIFALLYDQHDSFTIINENILPLTLSPNQSEILQISFVPTQSQLTEWSFDVLTSQQNNLQRVAVLGSQYSVWRDEVFEIEVDGIQNSDILFSVDLSGSMSDEVELLGQQFEIFIQELSNYTTDWQVMVVNADHGCNHSGILTPQTTNYIDTFLTAVQTGAYDISFTEALLTNVTHAVEKTDSGECNEGFLRQNAMLHIIMLSDECEQSPNPGICGTQWQDYIDRITTQKGDPSLVRMSAIAGDYPSGCGNPTSAQFGSGYWESTQITNGLFISICSNWTDPYYLQQLALTSTQIVEFTLQAQPITESIIVSVNGIPTTNYVYHANTNTITITESISANSSVSIQYQEYIDCTNQ